MHIIVGPLDRYENDDFEGTFAAQAIELCIKRKKKPQNTIWLVLYKL